MQKTQRREQANKVWDFPSKGNRDELAMQSKSPQSHSQEIPKLSSQPKDTSESLARSAQNKREEQIRKIQKDQSQKKKNKEQLELQKFKLEQEEKEIRAHQEREWKLLQIQAKGSQRDLEKSEVWESLQGNEITAERLRDERLSKADREEEREMEMELNRRRQVAQGRQKEKERMWGEESNQLQGSHKLSPDKDLQFEIGRQEKEKITTDDTLLTPPETSNQSNPEASKEQQRYKAGELPSLPSEAHLLNDHLHKIEVMLESHNNINSEKTGKEGEPLDVHLSQAKVLIDSENQPSSNNNNKANDENAERQWKDEGEREDNNRGGEKEGGQKSVTDWIKQGVTSTLDTLMGENQTVNQTSM